MTERRIKESKSPNCFRLPLFEEGRRMAERCSIEPTEWKAIAGNQLRNDASLQFDYLFCLTCIDWKTHLTMVYHLIFYKIPP